MPFDAMTSSLAPSDHGRRRGTRPVALWLLVVAGMIWAMVALGGATRLTGSGLSIMEWAPIMGSLPPFSQAEWQRLYDLYREIPQYRLVNAGFGMEGFQRIFWLEWAHRFWGRMIGLAYLLPLLWFWASGRIGRAMLPRFLVLLALGATFAIEDVSGHLVLVLLMSALVLRAVRGPASASGERSNPIVSPYRGVEGDEVLPLPRVVEQRFGLVDARLREQLLLSAWALFCLELATPDVGLWTLGIFILGCLFAFALGRRKQALIPIAPPLLLLAAQQGVFTQPSSTWGAIAITLGFASLLGGLFAAWWRETARVARSARAPSVRVTRRLAKYARPHVG